MTLEQTQCDLHMGPPVTLVCLTLRAYVTRGAQSEDSGVKAEDHLVRVGPCKSCPLSVTLSTDIQSIFSSSLYLVLTHLLLLFLLDFLLALLTTSNSDSRTIWRDPSAR